MIVDRYKACTDVEPDTIRVTMGLNEARRIIDSGCVDSVDVQAIRRALGEGSNAGTTQAHPIAPDHGDAGKPIDVRAIEIPHGARVLLVARFSDITTEEYFINAHAQLAAAAERFGTDVAVAIMHDSIDVAAFRIEEQAKS